jgi:uncharacterized membrane protein YfcA
MKFAIALLAGVVTGVVSSWGVGGGTILVLYLTGLAKVPQKQAQGINLLFFLPTSIAALISHIRAKLIVWLAVIPAVIAGVPAAIALSLAASCVESELLRRIFGGFVVAVGLFELFAKRKSAAQK